MLGLAATIGAGAAMAGIGQAMSDTSSVGQSLLGNYLNRKNTKYTAGLSWKQYKAQRALDWDYFLAENEQNYKLQQRYALNSAKWQMEGLKKAKINPILALGGGAPSPMQAPSASPTGGSLPSNNIPSASVRGSALNLSSAIRDVASTDMMLSTAQKVEKEAELPEATKDKLRADAELTRANAAKTIAITAAELERIQSETSINKSRKALTDRQTEIVDRPHTFLAETADWALRRVVDAFKNGMEFKENYDAMYPSNYGHSAKDDGTHAVSPHSGHSYKDAEIELQEMKREYYKRIFRDFRGNYGD